MTNYLILDQNDIALNCLFVAIPDGGRMIQYDGPFFPGGKFDGTTVIDPDPQPGVPQSSGVTTVDLTVKQL